MNVEGLESLFRYQLDDNVEPYLVDSDVFLEHLNEAQEEACIRARLIFDRTSGFCTINLIESKQSYELDEVVYSITDAFVTDSSGEVTKLIITDRIELDRMFPEWRQESGLPRYLVQYDGHAELVPAPDSSAATLNIECHILPDDLTSNCSIPQINKANHRRLLHWVKYRAYDAQDNDLHDKSKSIEELAMFEKIFGIRPTANNTRNQYSNRAHRNKVCI